MLVDLPKQGRVVRAVDHGARRDLVEAGNVQSVVALRSLRQPSCRLARRSEYAEGTILAQDVPNDAVERCQ